MLVFCQTAKYFLLKEMFIGFLKLSNEGCYEVCVFISSVIHILSSHLLMTYCGQQTNRRQVLSLELSVQWRQRHAIR